MNFLIRRFINVVDRNPIQSNPILNYNLIITIYRKIISKLNKRVLFYLLIILVFICSCNKNDEITGRGSSGGGGNRGNSGDSSKIIGNDHKNFNMLIGTWQGQDPENLSEAYIFDGKIFFAEPSTYSIEVLEISWTTDTQGFFYGKYISHYSNSEEYIGKYYAISFKDLTETDLKISGALNGKLGSADAVYKADTLEEAKTIFTIENNSFSNYTICKKETTN